MDTESDDGEEQVSGWQLQSSLPSSDTFGAGLPHNSESSEDSDGEYDEEEGSRGERPELAAASTRDSSVLFRRLDSGSGALDWAAVEQAVRELWPQFDHEPALRRAFQASDRDSNGCVGRREFHLLLSNIVHFDALWKLFDTIEEGNPENRMELEDFQAACAAVAMQTSEGATAEFREQARAEGVSSMHLGFDHFCSWMLAQKRQAHLTGGAAAAKRNKPAPRSPIARASPQTRQSNSDTESDGEDDEQAVVSTYTQSAVACDVWGYFEDGVALQQAPAAAGSEEEEAEPEPEPESYDSDSGDSELSDDDTAVALLARLQTMTPTSAVKPSTPARKAVAASPVAPSPAQARLSQLLDELGSPPPGRGRRSQLISGQKNAGVSSALRQYESP